MIFYHRIDYPGIVRSRNRYSQDMVDVEPVRSCAPSHTTLRDGSPLWRYTPGFRSLAGLDMWSDHLRGRRPEGRRPGWHAQILTASVPRPGAAAPGHPARYCQTRYPRPTWLSDTGRTTSSTAGPPTGDLIGCTSPVIIYLHACDPAGRPVRQSI